MKINSEKLKALRIKLGYTQSEIANKCKIHQGVYSNWEIGKRCPSLENLLKIASALNININKLIDEGVISSNLIPQNTTLESILKKLPNEFVRLIKFYETLPDDTKRKIAREAMDEAVKRAIDKM